MIVNGFGVVCTPIQKILLNKKDEIKYGTWSFSIVDNTLFVKQSNTNAQIKVLSINRNNQEIDSFIPKIDFNKVFKFQDNESSSSKLNKIAKHFSENYNDHINIPISRY